MKQPYNTALYMRLSRDDENYGDSVSIETQRTILQQYAKEHGLSVLWRREIQNKNGANSKTTEYAANIQKADLEEALPGPLSYVLSSIPSLCAAALAIVMCASIPTASKPSSAAAASVVPLPANGSRILPPGTHICTT